MNIWIIAAGAVAGLGIAGLIRELLPGPVHLGAALARLDSAPVPGAVSGPGRYGPGAVAPPHARRGHGSVHARRGSGSRRAGRPAGPLIAGGLGRLGVWLAAAAPWLPDPTRDLALLGRDRESWLASKVGLGLAGLLAPPCAAVALTAAGFAPSLAVPTAAAAALGCAMFFLPDLAVRVSAQRYRADFRHALASYLDLVALERGAGAGPTEALEAAAEIGGGWEFQRITAALDAARRTGRTPWSALASLAEQTGVAELADIADIAEVAGQEGAKILQTLAARAGSMRAQALAADRARAGSRSTTMVVPIALLGAGFLVLLIFPTIYRILGP